MLIDNKSDKMKDGFKQLSEENQDYIIALLQTLVFTQYKYRVNAKGKNPTSENSIKPRENYYPSQ